MLLHLFSDCFFIGPLLVLQLLLLLLVQFGEELLLLLFKLDSVLLVLEHHTFQLLVHVHFFHFFDFFTSQLSFIIAAFIYTVLLVLVQSVTRKLDLIIPTSIPVLW